jgi:hypothetical protein
MIDKRVIVLIGVLVVVAILVLAFSTMKIDFSSKSGKSFSELIDSMEEKIPGSLELVLPSTYTNNQQITITDRIVAMESTDYSTTFYFLYTGTKWANETTGTDFEILTYMGGNIHVRHAMFSITIVAVDLHAMYDIGDMITLKTSVKISGGKPVLSGTWVVMGA